MNNYELTNIQFEELVRNGKSFVLHFWAEWNGYDIEQKKILDRARRIYPKIDFFGMNIDRIENFDICVKHNLVEIPMIVFYRRGYLKSCISGKLIDMNQLNTELEVYKDSS